MVNSFWEQPETVERFSSRTADDRLEGLLDTYDDPAGTPVLDLGCAGGRNTELLAKRGFDVWAVDSSKAMVERTRGRLAPILGQPAARDRVILRAMDDLSPFGNGQFSIIVAYGIFHNAQSWAEWQRAVSETARVLATGGKLLVYHFTPEVDLTGEGVSAIPDERHTFDGLGHGRGVLLDAADLDAEMTRHGLEPAVPSETLRLESDIGRRVIVSALYTRTGSSTDPIS